MATPLYYVGSPAEVEHHARPLAAAFDLRIVGADEVVHLAQPGELCVFFNEYYPRFRDACVELKAKGCATLYAIDGILEWRNSWELPERGDCCLWVMRPVLSHKVACIGRSQARVLESWGNFGKCEVVGVPRFDKLAGCQPRIRQRGEPFRVLVITAKCPGFSSQQIACTTQSLHALKHWFDGHPRIGNTSIEPVWRLTRGLDEAIGVDNRLTDTTGQDLATVLQSVDAVIATPSTAMLEGMLQGLPVAVLDYHNRPHYVPAAWRITAESQIDEVLCELANPTPARMLYQASILHDALECNSSATPRFVELAMRMHELAQACHDSGQTLTFPRRILSDAQDGHHLPEPNYDHQSLYPRRLLHTGTGRSLPLSDSVDVVAREGFSVAAREAVPAASRAQIQAGDFLDGVRNPTFGWHHLCEELEPDRRKEIAQATAALERELRQTRRELQVCQRQSLRARLARLEAKIRRHLWLQPRDAPQQGPASGVQKAA